VMDSLKLSLEDGGASYWYAYDDDLSLMWSRSKPGSADGSIFIPKERYLQDKNFTFLMSSSYSAGTEYIYRVDSQGNTISYKSVYCGISPFAGLFDLNKDGYYEFTFIADENKKSTHRLYIWDLKNDILYNVGNYVFLLPYYEFTSWEPLIDIDNDGYRDLVIIENTGGIYRILYDGSELSYSYMGNITTPSTAIYWPGGYALYKANTTMTLKQEWKVNLDNIREMDVGDIDGDGNDEVVGVTTSNYLIAIDDNGSILFNRSLGYDTGIIKVSDINLDGKSEIIVAGRVGDSSIHVYFGNGSTFWSDYLGNWVDSIYVGNIDSSAQLEVLAGTWGIEKAWSYNGSLLWTYTGTNTTSGISAMYDFDSDGYDEIIIGTSSKGNGLHFVDNDGSLIWLFPGKSIWGTPAEIDGINGTDIIAFSLPSKIYGILLNGSLMWELSINYTTVLIMNNPRAKNAFSVDWNEDGYGDLVVYDGVSGNVSVISGEDGTIINRFYGNFTKIIMFSSTTEDRGFIAVSNSSLIVYDKDMQVITKTNLSTFNIIRSIIFDRGYIYVATDCYVEKYSYSSRISTVDLTPPHFVMVAIAPERPREGDTVTVRVNVTDASGIAAVKLSYRNDSSIWINVTMTYNTAIALWEATIPDAPAGTTIYYKIYACDNAGNWAISATYSYTVALPDTNPPIFAMVTITPEQPREGDTVTVRVNVTDISGIDTVKLSYRNESSIWINVTMTYNTAIALWEATIPDAPAGTTIYYKIYACDSAGNWAVSATYNYTVIARTSQQPSEPTAPPNSPNSSSIDQTWVMLGIGGALGFIAVMLLKRPATKKIPFEEIYASYIDKHGAIDRNILNDVHKSRRIEFARWLSDKLVQEGKIDLATDILESGSLYEEAASTAISQAIHYRGLGDIERAKFYYRKAAELLRRAGKVAEAEEIEKFIRGLYS